MPTHTAPWKKPKPKSKNRTKLSAANIAWAKARAKKAGRRYPNLIDNMEAARRQNEKKTGSKTERTRP